MLILQEVSGLVPLRRFEYGPASIGRDPSCDICLEGMGLSMVSGSHARVFKKGDAWYVEDAGSVQGTYLNGSRLRGPVELRNGHLFSLAISGPTFKVRIEASQTAIARLRLRRDGRHDQNYHLGPGVFRLRTLNGFEVRSLKNRDSGQHFDIAELQVSPDGVVLASLARGSNLLVNDRPVLKEDLKHSDRISFDRENIEVVFELLSELNESVSVDEGLVVEGEGTESGASSKRSGTVQSGSETDFQSGTVSAGSGRVPDTAGMGSGGIPGVSAGMGSGGIPGVSAGIGSGAGSGGGGGSGAWADSALPSGATTSPPGGGANFGPGGAPRGEHFGPGAAAYPNPSDGGVSYQGFGVAAGPGGGPGAAVPGPGAGGQAGPGGAGGGLASGWDTAGGAAPGGASGSLSAGEPAAYVGTVVPGTASPEPFSLEALKRVLCGERRISRAVGRQVFLLTVLAFCSLLVSIVVGLLQPIPSADAGAKVRTVAKVQLFTPERGGAFAQDVVDPEQQFRAHLEGVFEQLGVRRSEVGEAESINIMMYLESYRRPGLRRKAAAYLPHFFNVFKEYNVPTPLMFLPWVESAFDPGAQSQAGARGMWQFMDFTAERYKLKATSGSDDQRLDWQAQTKIAAQYLRDLLEVDNPGWDPLLAIAAYNCGEGCMLRALERYDALPVKPEYEGDPSRTSMFWLLRRAGILPQETAEYVPRLLAVAICFQYSENYPEDTESR